MKLSEMLAMWRAERPDEWRMDEFIRMAKKLESDNLEVVKSEIIRAAKVVTITERIDDDMIEIIRPSKLIAYAENLKGI